MWFDVVRSRSEILSVMQSFRVRILMDTDVQ